MKVHIPSIFLKPLLAGFRRVTERREYDYAIGGEENPYLLRWHILPFNRFLNVYLHKFKRSDDPRALHDHPYWSLSIMVKGRYIEHLEGGKVRFVKEGDVVLRNATDGHRVELIADGNRGLIETWTVFIVGPRIREWGFLCPQGWRHWKDFAKGAKPGEIGKGCGEP